MTFSSRYTIVWVLLGILLMALVLALVFWIGVALAVLGLVFWLNLIGFTMISARLHIPARVTAALLLPVAAGIGFAFGQTGGLAVGIALWVLGVALPQVLLWRLRGRLSATFGGRNSRGELPVIDAHYRPLDNS